MLPLASSRNYALQIHKIYEWKVCGLDVLQTLPHLILDILLFCRVFSVGIILGPWSWFSSQCQHQHRPRMLISLSQWETSLALSRMTNLRTLKREHNIPECAKGRRLYMTLIVLRLLSSSALFRMPLKVPLQGPPGIMPFNFIGLYKCTVCGLAALCV